jgi:hypothetical protein
MQHMGQLQPGGLRQHCSPKSLSGHLSHKSSFLATSASTSLAPQHSFVLGTNFNFYFNFNIMIKPARCCRLPAITLPHPLGVNFAWCKTQHHHLSTSQQAAAAAAVTPSTTGLCTVHQRRARRTSHFVLASMPEGVITLRLTARAQARRGGNSIPALHHHAGFTFKFVSGISIIIIMDFNFVYCARPSRASSLPRSILFVGSVSRAPFCAQLAHLFVVVGSISSATLAHNSPASLFRATRSGATARFITSESVFVGSISSATFAHNSPASLFRATRSGATA